MPANVSKEATGPTTPVDVGQATATDLADPAPGITRSPENNDFAVGNHTIIWTATDASGNEATATQTVTITDKTAPVITLLKDTTTDNTVELGTAYTEHGATATDLVDNDTELTSKIVINTDNVNPSAVGTYSVTYDVSDAKGNAAETMTRTVRVTDTTAPVITAPDDETFEATATLTPLSQSDYGIATSTDDTAVLGPSGQAGPGTATTTNDTATISSNAPETFPLGDTIITWTATDTSGNKETAEQTITVIDTTAPEITLTGANPQIIEFGEGYTELEATATDLVDDDTELTSKIAIAGTVDTSAVGTYEVTYEVTDTAGNHAERVIRTVIVEDTTTPDTTPDITAPDISAPPAQTFEAIATMTPLDRSNYGSATSTDREAEITDDAPDAFPMGNTMITWIATGTNKLSSSAQQMITVMDTTSPTITLLKDTADDNTIELGTTYTEHGATAVDNMAGDLTDRIVIDATDLDTNTVGKYTVTYTVMDQAMNQAQASRSVQVLASPDFADLNRVILSEVARTMADQNVEVVARRIEQAGKNAARAASVGGQSSLANILAAQGRALADDQFSIKQLLAEADFVLPLSEDAAPGTSVPTFWGAGDYRELSGSDRLDWDGDFLSLHLGADAHMDDMIAGVALSWSRADVDYRNYHTPQTAGRAGRDDASGEYQVDMTSVHPYMGWTSGQMDFWATLGYGDGELKITDDDDSLQHASSDLDLRTFAVGGSGPLPDAGATNLRVKAEALHSELIVAGGEQIAAMELDVSRLRLTLEATRSWSLRNGARLDLNWQGGLRYDGGSGNTGAGNEVGGGLRYVDAAGGLTLEGKVRGLVRDKGDTDEWGVSGLIKFQRSPHGRGLSFSLTPGYGETDRILQEFWQQDLRDDDEDAEPQGSAPRLDIRLGYGMSGPGGHGLLTPYSEITLGNNGDTYRLGLAWKLDPLFDVKLVTERRESIDEVEQSIVLDGTITF